MSITPGLKELQWSAQVIRTGMGFSEEIFAELKQKLPQACCTKGFVMSPGVAKACAAECSVCSLCNTLVTI